MKNILRELFTNATIIVSFITFGNLFLREKGINPSSPMYRKIIVGTFGGILGCGLMLYSIQVSPSIILDFRNIPIIIMAIYASFPSVVVTSLIIGIFRIINYGFSQSSFIAFIVAIIMGLGCGFIGKMKINRLMKWVYSVIIVCVVAGVAFTRLLATSPLLDEVLFSYCIGTILVSILMYYFMEYINNSNELYRQMKEDSKKDFLTGLNNERQFNNLLNNVLKNSGERNESLSILYIDIDFFKNVNDDFGHLAGNQVLKELGEILTRMCRSFDIVSRIGGEEFSVILLDCRLLQAIEVAERIRKTVEQHNFVLDTGKEIRVTVSIGVSSFPDTITDLQKILEQSDIALYKAKRAGKNRVEVA